MSRMVVIIAILAFFVNQTCQAEPSLNNAKVAHIVGTIDEESTFSFEMEMLTTASLRGDRLILIDSPGGSVRSGERMLSTIKAEQDKGVKVVCVVINHADSMAFDILTRCNERWANRSATMLVHKVRTILPKDAIITAARARVLADSLDRTDAPYRASNAKAMRLTLGEYDKFADNETEWSAQSLLIKGYLNGYVGGK